MHPIPDFSTLNSKSLNADVICLPNQTPESHLVNDLLGNLVPSFNPKHNQTIDYLLLKQKCYC